MNMFKSKLKNSAFIFGRILTFFITWAVFLAIFITLFDTFIAKLVTRRSALETLITESIPVVAILMTNWVINRYTVNGKLDVYKLRLGQLFSAFLIGMIWVGTAIFGQVSTNSLYQVQAEYKIEPVTLAIFAFALLLNTIFQELLFRGYLFKIFEDNLNSTKAIILSSLIFLGFHAGAIQAGIIPAINVFGAGVIFAILYYKTRSIWVPVIVHYLWNAIMLFVGLTKIPNYPSFNLLTLYGSNLFAGGDNGIEATISTSFIIGIMIFVLARYMKKV
jgi:uncharacterized protein